MKYNYTQIQEVVRLLLHTTHTYLEIATKTGVHIATIRDIANNRGQRWIYENLDENLFKAARELRRPHYLVWDRNNCEYQVDTQAEFLKQHTDCSPTLFKRGYTRAGYQLWAHEVGELYSPQNTMVDTKFNITNYLKTQGLSAYKIRKIFQGKIVQQWAYKKLA